MPIQTQKRMKNKHKYYKTVSFKEEKLIPTSKNKVKTKIKNKK